MTLLIKGNYEHTIQIKELLLTQEKLHTYLLKMKNEMIFPAQ